MIAHRVPTTKREPAVTSGACAGKGRCLRSASHAASERSHLCAGGLHGRVGATRGTTIPITTRGTTITVTITIPRATDGVLGKRVALNYADELVQVSGSFGKLALGWHLMSRRALPPPPPLLIWQT